ncbi:glutaredoxin domain-containing protein [Microbacterium enclense]|uniref:Ribonucleoside-diphosphate reductase class Ib glutaredoxin subunit n=1 Tax=Microbacterium enclense TaxID=993073 RepID=A0A1G6NTP2_9MICO|nr:glutaredoxin domain-containing protein [Microbacterium enclense]KSU52887.1 hypothetical protein AS029_12830 [Microbacterium enclense]SDC71179.1 ribonucleoside-diphosphate reductase class Ib glutaredoxin subunit [Microbacterium enclense]
MTTVRVYTKPDCRQCDLTKTLLTKRGVDFTIEDLTDPGNLAAAKALGHQSAPVVIAGEESWAGFRPDLIGELADRLTEEVPA